MKPPQGQRRRPLWMAGTALFAFALGLRLLYLWQIRSAPFFDILMGDSKGYDAWAMRIAGGDWMGNDVFYQAPLYPYTLGVIYALVGHSVLAVRLVQSVLGAVSVVLIAEAARRLFSARTGLAAGLMLAIYPPAIFFDGLLQKTALDAFFTTVALWILSRLIGPGTRHPALGTRPPGHWHDWAGLGLAMGALSLTRENALALVVVLAIWCVARSADRDRWRHLAAFAACLAIVLVPVAVRNYAVGGGFYLTTSQFGPNLYLGNNPKTDGTAGSLIGGRGSSEYERQDAIDIAERAAGRPLSPAEVSSYWTGETLTFVRSDPGKWLALMARKFALLWNVSEAFDTESQESYGDWSWLIRIGATIGHFGVLVPLAFLGVAATWSDRRRLAILYVLVAAYAASVVIFFIYARYRYPLVPFLLLFAAAAVIRLPEYWRSHSTKTLALVGGATLLVVIFTNVPLLSATANRAVTEHNLGAELQSQGQFDAAIEHYQRAIAINPDYVPAYSNLGSALLARGRAADAITVYERALTLDPAFPDVHFNLGNALLQQDKPHAAIDHFQRALAAAPNAVDARTNLGVALIADDRLEDGIRELQAAVRLAPRSAAPRRALGEALGLAGRTAEAIEELRQAVALSPADGQAQYALGRLFLVSQHFPAAIEHLQAALVATPGATEIRNELGIALASSGRLDEAIAQFQQALRERPGYVEAQRNLNAALVARGRQ